MELKPGYKQTEMGEIPEDWQVRKLSGLATILHGYGFQSQYFNALGKYRLTTPGHFHETGGFRDVGDKQKFYDGPLPDGYLLIEGDLIVAMTEQADGLLGSAALIPAGDRYLHNQRLGKVKVISPVVSSKFLYYVFNSEVYRAKVRETAAGTKVKHTSPSKLLEIPVALPPTKTEQEAIAEALGDADVLIESLEQLIAKKRQIKQGAMQELLTGKRRLPGFSEKWKVKQLGDVCYMKSGVSITSIDIDEFSEFPCYGGNGLRGFSKRYTHDGSYALIGRQGALCGNVLTVYGRFFASEHAIVVTSQKETEIRWLSLVLARMNLNQYSESSAQPGLSVAKLLMLECIVPPLAEQIAIAEILSDMDAEIAELEAKLAKARQLKQGMMQELLTGRIRLV
jgi:type I restriction enzyme S subunit